KAKPESFELLASQLFEAMKDGGWFGASEVAWFNGGLFTDGSVIALDASEIAALHGAAQLDWSAVEPAIFGTLFERSLDPDKRTQIGAHYTAPEDIRAILEPTVLVPLRREWTEVQAQVEIQLARFAKAKSKATRDKAWKAANDHVGRFLDRLRTVKVLDPACGSGNFLYLALRGLKDLEGEVIGWAARHEIGPFIPYVSPLQLYGIEINPYARELAQVVVWIGHLQWAYQNGFHTHEKPILKAFENIRLGDAILDGVAGAPPRPEWPAVDFIVGNPPFLGGKYLRKYLGDVYVDRLFAAWNGLVLREADLVCYWFERAREHIAAGKARRAGLVATNSIRGGPNRKVLERILASGGIFMAWTDRPWVLDGAAVRVSMVGFDDGSDAAHVLDGNAVQSINADLSTALDLTQAKRLRENQGIAFMGDTKGGPFDIPGQLAKEILDLPNPLGRKNRDVVKPWANGLDVVRRPRDMWIIALHRYSDRCQASPLCPARRRGSPGPPAHRVRPR
ncbi:MAG: DNA methyltransferase, partial [Myxococcota bacterium]